MALTDRDGFLDRCDGHGRRTWCHDDVVEVQGGLDALADAEFSRVVAE